MDSKIKEHFDRFREKGEQPPELKESGIEAIPIQDEEFLSNARKWQTEPKYENEDLGVVVRGGVDDILRAENGSLIVLDYKTRGYSPGDEAPDYYTRQVNLYNLILRENGYPTKDFGLLLYYYPDEILEGGEVIFENEVKRVDVDIEEARSFVRDAVKTLEGPIPEHNDDCEFCEWNNTNHGN
ncbi:MAG: PD-(D/E)XK nuclease family protein [Candidatus Aenigmatarchaeota archaeon]